MKNLLEEINKAGPAGVESSALLAFESSTDSLNKRLDALEAAGAVRRFVTARLTRYVATSPFSRESIDQFFAIPWQDRPMVFFDENFLSSDIGIGEQKALRLQRIQALIPAINRQLLARFLVDFSWGSSVLEGSSYSELDTEALVVYGQNNNLKPTEDAVLTLNHKQAAEFLWANQQLSVENVCKIHALLTDGHGLIEVEDSDHFLDAHQRGIAREFEEVNLGASAYVPVFRPGTGYIKQALQRIVDTANKLEPVQAAFYLLTRIPYLQAFANGNKRTGRAAANIPLLKARLAPLSFADMNKGDYIRGMATFYELGLVSVIEEAFIHAYTKSIVRSSHIPLHVKMNGFSLNVTTNALADFVATGNEPQDEAVRLFLTHQ